MLAPRDRLTYLQALKPPAGYELEHAVGTTYTVDLKAMLSAPVSMALFDAEDQGEEGSPDPLAILESVRRYAERIDVFCDATQTKEVKSGNVLYGLLEPMLHPVHPPKDGAFHPKVWVLQFKLTNPDIAIEHDANNESPPASIFRLVCLSRNLTFDRSWDTVLVLEGRRTNFVSKSVSLSKPIASLIRSLPAMVREEMPKARKERVLELAEEVSKVQFALPDDVEAIRFFTYGIGDKSDMHFDHDFEKLLILSPFLDQKPLMMFREGSIEPPKAVILISRQDQLDGIDASCFESKIKTDDGRLGTVSTFVLNGEMQVDADEAEVQEAAAIERDIHAKVYIGEYKEGRSDLTSIVVGSLNATTAARERNIEFAVELVSKRRKLSIDQFMNGEDGKSGFAKALVPYRRRPVDPKAAIRMALEKDLMVFKRALITQSFNLKCSNDGDGYYLHLNCKETKGAKLAWPAIHVWPSYSRESQAQDAKLLFAGQELIFGKFRLGAINGLLCFKIVVAKDGEELSSVVTLKVPVQDMPEGRDDAIFQSIVSDEKSFVRYLMFLLATESSVGDIAKVRGLGRQRGGGGSQNDGLEVPFFEELMRAYVRTPERIDSIDAVISRLKTGEGQDKGPVSPEFLLIWNEVWKARCEARGAI